MSRWFRHYAGMMRDDKLVRVSLRTGQTVERVLWVWGAILESASEINDDGRYDLDAAEAAYFLRAAEADIRAIEASLADCGRLSEGRVAKWGDRQFKSDDSTDRVRKHRQSKSQGNGVDRARSEKSDRYSNDDVTATKRRGNAPETETEQDSVADATGEPSSPKTLDPKTLLFRDGLTTLAKLAGRKPAALRPVIGRWMKLTGDDAGALLAEIERCRGSPVADPISWIEQRLKPKDPNGKPRRITNAEQSAAAMAWAINRANGGDERQAEFAEPDHGDETDGGRGRGAPPASTLAHGHRTG